MSKTRYGEQSILYYEDVCQYEFGLPDYPQHLSNQLLDSIKLGDIEQARKHMQHIVQSVLMREYHYDHVVLTLIQLAVELLNLMQASSLDQKSLVSGDLSILERLRQLKQADEVVDWFMEELIIPLITNLERKENNMKRISRDVLQLIEEGFDTPLTLEEAASRLNYHKAYISKVLREETGTNFTDTLSSKRLAMAKKWLVETEMTVTEISEKLQFYSAANFNRYFKKHEGITPGRYRELYRSH